MKNKIFQLVESTRKFVANKTIIAAVSGGKDSVYMLYVLSKASPKRLVVAHFNHKSRPESDDDESFVKELAKKFNLPFIVETLTTPPPTGVSVESYYREKRYEFLKNVLTSQKGNLISTAHTANDIVETFLFRLFTGRALRIPKQIDDNLFRPLYFTTTDEVLKALKYLKQDFRVDQTNFDLRYDRNFIRKIVQDLMQRFGKRLIINTLQKAIFINKRAGGMTKVVDAFWQSMEDRKKNVELIKTVIEKIRDEELSLFVLARWLYLNLGFEVGHIHCVRFRNFLNSHAKEIQFPLKKKLVKEENFLTIYEVR
ncbi:MAG: tRNA lysidine(34) synthetase TilS [Deltaproteobacteria bacterium]|nr:tRNA lysidine(34) synthetase TilS [Deltaproteobacteria bacterium]MCX7953044.1 tRNA lysidine(34) synthetase TilS [Deltaproteobacteria bacterium]